MATPWRLFWLLVLAGHAVAASAWWWLMPGGFPVLHPRFWANREAPVAVLLVVAIAVLAARRGRLHLLSLTLAVFPVAWAAAAIAARVVFPITFCGLFLLPLFGASVMGAAAFLTFRRQEHSWRRPLVAVTALVTLLGAALPGTQRAPAPDTRPFDLPMPRVISSPDPVDSVLDEVSNPRIRVHPRDGSLTVQAGSLRLGIEPLLRFLSRSPDGCWTILAPRGTRSGRKLVLETVGRAGDRLAFQYRSDYEAALLVDPGREGAPVRLEAMAHLAHPVFSHLNSFCDVLVSGHRRLSIAFSPCPETVVEVRPAEYPVGRPLRLAYLDAQGTFHVVEATSGEKGPFRELGRGRLTRSQPLAITLYDLGVAQARVVLEDWSAQVGTALSPTAGWGLPVNAIEFGLEGDGPGSPAGIYITLAGTSVGRGWDSVGHGAGTYRNRMSICRP
jgi:hypothetical protein